MRFARFAAGLAVAALISAPALAAPKPNFGPPPKWVEVADIPEAPPAEGAPAVQTLLDDNQSRLTPQGDTYYNRRVRKVLKAEGLASLTTFGVTWDPADETVTVHSLRLIRDGQTIDLLAKGKKMLVLRREQELEKAMLDGRMSATQQIEGLQVGDILDASWTHSGRDPVAGSRSYDMEGLGFPGVAGRYRVRLSWPTGTPIKYRTTQGFGEPKETRDGGWTYLTLDAAGAQAPKPPVGAPPRFRRLGYMETSSFESWNEISRIMAPLYDRAATISRDSGCAPRSTPSPRRPRTRSSEPSRRCGWSRTRPATSSSASATAATCRRPPTRPGRGSSGTARARPHCCWRSSRS